MLDKIKIGKKPKPEPSFKYEEVTDLSVSEKAKAMIDGEVFYDDAGEYEYSFDSAEGKFFVRKANNATIGGVVRAAGIHYRKIETQWREKLDGTIENAVLCWVSWDNEHARNRIALIVDKDEIGYYQLDGENHDRWEWNYVTPFSKDELAVLTANAPGANNGSKSI